MTDSIILDRMVRGFIHIDLETLRVSVYHTGQNRWILKVPEERHGRLSYRFGDGKKKGGRKKIFLNRLVWMWTHGKVIPDGYVVDHKDGDKRNNSPSNLQLMRDVDSHRQGLDRQTDDHLESWKDFFDFIAFMGHAPPEGHPLWD